MNNNYRRPKTLGPQGARLISGVYGKNLSSFTVEDATQITGLTAPAARNLIDKLVKKGIVTRLKPGLYKIVPFDHGDAGSYFGNPYEVASQVVSKVFKEQSEKPKYFVSHGSAMDLHQMVTQPQLTVFVSTTKMIRNQTIMGTDFHFITVKKDLFFGTTEHWLTKTEKIIISDIERTILDGLKIPGYSGGIIEVAKGLWMKRQDINMEKLLEYAEKIDIGAVYRRLGFILDTLGLGGIAVSGFLKSKLTNTYHLLDPELGPEGKHMAKWRLRLNVTEDEIKAVIRT